MARETKAAIMAGIDHVKAKRIANNTVEYVRANGERIIRLHHTDIVTFAAKNRSVTLNSGGWKTVTTKDRINTYLENVNVFLFSHKGVWYVRAGNGWSVEDAVPFYDGIRIGLTDKGPVLPRPKKKIADRELKLAKKINAFVKTLRHPIPVPGTGDCLFCRLNFIETPRDYMGVTQGSDNIRDLPGENLGHILSHIDEGYLHGSLLLRAMKWSGFSEQRISWEFGGQLRNVRSVRAALRRYLRHKLGLSQGGPGV